jgi:hypothetical protein
MNASAARILNAGTLRVLLNIAVFQAAWFACVGFAARGAADWGIAAIGAAVALHFALSDARRADAVLAVAALAIGIVWETLALRAGWIAYASPGPVAGLAPAWILALWVLFATALREPLRWLHGRPALAALFGAVGGPLSYAAGARLGACRFDDPTTALLALGAGWAVLTPLLLALARRLEAGRGRAAR